jgi:hypothetical protein
MNRRWGCVLAWGLSACAPEGSPTVSMSLALSRETAARIAQFQVSLLRRDSVDCGDLSSSCVKQLGLATVPLADGAPAHRAPYVQGQPGVSLALEVDAGTYSVVVEALDAQGLVVANACRLNIDLSEGTPQSVAMELAPFSGTCEGLLSP